MNIGVDIDGVLVNWVDQMARFCGDLPYGENGTPSWTHFSTLHPERWAMYQANPNMQRGVFLDALPYRNAVEALRTLNGTHGVHLMTDRPAVAWPATYEWFARRGVAAKALLFVKAEEKATVAKALGLVHFIEDKPETVVALKEAGVDAWLLRRAYNTGLPWPENRCVYTLEEWATRLANLPTKETKK